MRRSQEERPLKMGWGKYWVLLPDKCPYSSPPVTYYVKTLLSTENSSTTLDKIYPTSSTSCLPISSFSHDESIGKRRTVCRHQSFRAHSDKKVKIKVIKHVFYVGASVFFFFRRRVCWWKIGLQIYIFVHIVFERMLRQNCSTSQCFQLLRFDNQYVSHK